VQVSKLNAYGIKRQNTNKIPLMSSQKTYGWNVLGSDSISFTANPTRRLKLPINYLEKILSETSTKIRLAKNQESQHIAYREFRKKMSSLKDAILKRNINEPDKDLYYSLNHGISNITVVSESLFSDGKVPIKNANKHFDHEANMIKNKFKLYQFLIDNKLGDKNPHEILDLAISSVADEATKKQVKINIQGKDLLDLDGVRLYLRKDKVFSVFNNLVHNAIKYSKDGGNIDIRFALSQKKGAKYLDFIIKDEGFGIPSEVQEKILKGYGGRGENVINAGIQGTGFGFKQIMSTVKKDLSEIEIISPRPERANDKKFPGSEIIYSMYAFLKN